MPKPLREKGWFPWQHQCQERQSGTAGCSSDSALLSEMMCFREPSPRDHESKLPGEMATALSDTLLLLVSSLSGSVLVFVSASLSPSRGRSGGVDWCCNLCFNLRLLVSTVLGLGPVWGWVCGREQDSSEGAQKKHGIQILLLLALGPWLVPFFSL